MISFYYKVLKDVVYYDLEDNRAINYIKEYHQIFEKITVYVKGCLLFISGLSADIVESLENI